LRSEYHSHSVDVTGPSTVGLACLLESTGQLVH
jgi:hypothetical protein